MKTNKKNKLPNHSGYTLIGVVLIITIISVLGTSIIGLTLYSINTSSSERNNQSAFYIAEAGLNLAANQINKELPSISNSASNQTHFFEEFDKYVINDLRTKYDQFQFEANKGNDPGFELNLQKIVNGNPSKYKMTSIGTTDIAKRDDQRQLEQEFSVEWLDSGSIGSIPQIAVLAKKKIELENGSLDGDIGVLNGGSGSIDVNNNILDTNDTIYVPINSSTDVVMKKHWVSIPEVEEKDISDQFPKLPEFPTIPAGYTELDNQKWRKNSNETYVIKDGELLINNWITNGYTFLINEDIQLKSIRLNENNHLYIDTKNEHRKIVVETLDMTNGHIHLKGDSKLTIYVTDEITFASGSTLNNNGNVNNLNIFIKGEEKLDLGGSQKIFGSIYLEKGDMNLGNGAGVKGNIFTGGNNIYVSGGTWATSTLILASNANFHHTNGTIKGSIFVDSYFMSGGARLKQERLEFVEGPISGEGIGSDSGLDSYQIEFKSIYEVEMGSRE